VGTRKSFASLTIIEMHMTDQEKIIQTVLDHYPDTQAIYLFGSWGTEDEWPSSDVDMAVLLPPQQAKAVDFWAWNSLATRLGDIVHKSVDLLNVRQVSTVFQKEVVMADRRLFCADEYAADEFEMLTLSFYQKLNQERAEILAEFKRTGKAYNV
jgi:predicted nucleotidyltransferase